MRESHVVYLLAFSLCVAVLVRVGTGAATGRGLRASVAFAPEPSPAVPVRPPIIFGIGQREAKS